MKKLTSEDIKEFVSRPLFDEKVIFNKDPSWPKISIITPSYNQGQFLEDTILSVLNQNYPNLEYIITDGGSTDGSVEIIKKYEKYITYWVSEPDRGQSHALNKGLVKATGDWIGWQNSDDVYLQECFNNFVNIIKKYPQYDVIFGNKVVIHEDSNINTCKIQLYFPSDTSIYVNTGMTMCNQSSFIRRIIFSEYGLLDEQLDFAMDHDFFLRLLVNNVNIFHSPMILGASRYHDGSKSCSENEKAWSEEIISINDKYGLIRTNKYKVKFLKLYRYFLMARYNRSHFLKEILKRLMLVQL